LPVAVLPLKVEFETLTKEEEEGKEEGKEELEAENTPPPPELSPVVVLPLKVEFETLTEEEELEAEYPPPITSNCIATKGWIWNTY